MQALAKFSSLVLAISLYLSGLGWSADYYVDKTGGGNFTTIAAAQAALTGNQSDNNLYFKRGQTWNESFTIGGYGTSGHPFTIGAYGSGALPIIDGQNSRIPISTTKNYVTVQDLEVKNSSSDGVKIGPPSSASITGVLLQRLTVHNSAQEGISVNNLTSSNAYQVTGITITNCISYDNGYAGIKGYAGVDHITVSYNTVYHNGLIPVSQWGWHGISFYGPDVTHRPSYVTIEHNEVYNQQEGGPGIASQEGTGIHCDDRCDHMIVRYNRSHDNDGAGICFNTNTNCSAYYNICVNNGLGTNSYTAGIYSTNSQYINIYNNVLYGNKNYGIYIINMDVAGTDFNIKNNIFMNNDHMEFRVYTSSGSIANFVADNNQYYNVNATSIFNWLNAGSGDLTWWRGRGSGHDQNGHYGDPLFVNPATGNFHLQAGSPCIDTGVDVGLTIDYEGNVVPR